MLHFKKCAGVFSEVWCIFFYLSFQICIKDSSMVLFLGSFISKDELHCFHLAKVNLITPSTWQNKDVQKEGICNIKKATELYKIIL